MSSSAPTSGIFVSCREEDVHVPFQRWVNVFFFARIIHAPARPCRVLLRNYSIARACMHTRCNRYATNYIRLPSISNQSPLPLSFFAFASSLLHPAAFGRRHGTQKTTQSNQKKVVTIAMDFSSSSNLQSHQCCFLHSTFPHFFFLSALSTVSCNCLSAHLCLSRESQHSATL